MVYYPWIDTTQYLEGDIVSFIPPIGAQALYFCITPALGDEQDPTHTAFWIVYTGGTAVQTITAGQGISIGGSSQNPSILTNISAQGPSLVLTPTTGTNYLLSNAQPFVGLSPGANVTITGGTSNAGVFTGGPLTIAAGDATPFLGLIPGSNIFISGGTSNAGNIYTGGPLTLDVTGNPGYVTSVGQGNGISVSGPVETPTVANTGVLNAYAGTGLASSGGQNPSISHNVMTNYSTLFVAQNPPAGTDPTTIWWGGAYNYIFINGVQNLTYENDGGITCQVTYFTGTSPSAGTNPIPPYGVDSYIVNNNATNNLNLYFWVQTGYGIQKFVGQLTLRPNCWGRICLISYYSGSGSQTFPFAIQTINGPLSATVNMFSD